MELDAHVITLIVAALTGGVALKVLDYIWKAISAVFSTPERRRKAILDDRNRLVDEVDKLRQEVRGLRSEINEIRVDLGKKVEQIAGLSARWYSLRVVVLSIITYIRHQRVLENDPELDRLVNEAIELVENHKEEQDGQ